MLKNIVVVFTILIIFDVCFRNLLNINEAGIVGQECKKFIEFTATESFIQAPHLHLSYLYDFIKLLFCNVKRPFNLYESCVTWIGIAHTTVNQENTELQVLITCL